MSEPLAVQLELFDPLDDGRTFGEWLESLPLDPSEKAGPLRDASLDPCLDPGE